MNLLLRSTAILGMVCFSAHADVTVANVRSAQRASTKLVDIDYDLSGGIPPFTVSVRVSSDDGATFTVPVTSLAGAFGAGQEAGANKRITWNAGVDWNGNYSANMRFEVTAIDSAIPPAPAGFVVIPAGNFQMGQVGVTSPVHTVYVSGFYMSKYETTKELWDGVRNWGGTHGYTDLAVGNGSYAWKGNNHPVHSITWYDVVKWCNARSEMDDLVPCYTVNGGIYRTGQSAEVNCNFSVDGYRLPTEAEWEKAARGGQVVKYYPWGDTIDHGSANYFSSVNYSYDVSATRGFHPSYAVGSDPYTAPVGSFVANGSGLYDMVGNIWEWCWDWFGDSYYSDASAVNNPRGPASGSYRTNRGGGWSTYAPHCRAAARAAWTPTNFENYIGFRMTRSAGN